VNRYAPLLKNPGFRAIWSAAIVSGLGDRIAAIALYLMIYDMTGSPLDLGLLAATQIIPAILLGPFVGLLCDRVSRKGIMVVSDLVAALVVAAIPLAQGPGTVYLLAALLGCGRQFAGPARMALLPDVVGRDFLGGANSLLMLTRNLVLLVGPAIGGALVAWKGFNPAFWFDALTFVASAAILTSWRFAESIPATTLKAVAATSGGSDQSVDALDETPEPPSTSPLQLWREAMVGLTTVLGSRGLRFAFGFFALITFVTAMQQPLVVVFVKEILAGSHTQLGIIISAAGLGGILGALGGGLAVQGKRLLRTIALLTALDGILLVIFALNRSFVGALVLFACFGALATLAQIGLATFLQRTAPDDTRGRTFGWLGTVVGPLSLAAVFLGPMAAELVGVAAVFLACGVAEILVAVWGFRAPAEVDPAVESPGQA